MGSRPGRQESVTVSASYEGIAAAGPVLPAVAAILERGDVVLVLGPPGRPDLAVLDGVARLALAARRAGTRLGVRAPDLAPLAGLCGLGCVLGPGDPRPPRPGSGQSAGQAQAGEQLGAQEVVDVGDPSA